jgi:hypothetical protein
MENETGNLASRVFFGLAVVAFLCSLYPAFYLAYIATALLAMPTLGEPLLLAYAFGIFFVVLLPLWRKSTGRSDGSAA